MKLTIDNQFVAYGPVGHPDARLFERSLGFDKNDVEGEFYGWVQRYASQNKIPTTFFDDKKSLEENGYYILPVENSEVSDELIATLVKPRMFTPAISGETGRKLQEFKSHIPYFYHHFDVEVWESGQTGCDHDFGLESFAVMFKERYSEVIYTIDAAFGPEMKDAEGDFYAQVICTRCGAKHALLERA